MAMAARSTASVAAANDTARARLGLVMGVGNRVGFRGDRGHQAAPSRSGWLKQLDRVAGRIVEQDLLPTRTGDHVIPEAHARPSQPSDLSIDVVDEQVNAIPPAWARAARRRAWVVQPS